MCRESNRIVYAALSQAFDDLASGAFGPALRRWIQPMLRSLISRINRRSRNPTLATAILEDLRSARNTVNSVWAQGRLAEAFVLFEEEELGVNYHDSGGTAPPVWQPRYRELFDCDPPQIITEPPQDGQNERFRRELAAPARRPTIEDCFGPANDDADDDDDGVVDLDQALPEPVRLVNLQLRRLRIDWHDLRNALQHITPGDGDAARAESVRRQPDVTSPIRQGFASARLADAAIAMPSQRAQSLPHILVGVDLESMPSPTLPDEIVVAHLSAIARNVQRLYSRRTVDSEERSRSRWLLGRQYYRELCGMCHRRGLTLPRDVLGIVRDTIISPPGEEAPQVNQTVPLTQNDRNALAATANVRTPARPAPAPAPTPYSSNRKRRSIEI